MVARNARKQAEHTAREVENAEQATRALWFANAVHVFASVAEATDFAQGRLSPLIVAAPVPTVSPPAQGLTAQPPVSSLAKASGIVASH